MNITQQIKYIVDQIVIAYCGDKQYEEDFENSTAQLMALTGLDRDGALKYACEVLDMSKCEGVA